LYRKPKQTAVKKYGDHTHPLGSLSKKAKIDQKLKSLRWAWSLDSWLYSW